MKNLKNITLYTQIHQFWDNESQKFLRLITFSWKSPKKLLHLLRDTQNSPSPLVKCCVKNGKAMLFQAVVARNDQGNMQPTLNKESGGASLTIFVIDCRYQISLWTKSFNFLGQGCPKRTFPKGLFGSWIFWFLILDIWIDSTYSNKARFQILASTDNFDSLE